MLYPVLAIINFIVMIGSFAINGLAGSGPDGSKSCFISLISHYGSFVIGITSPNLKASIVIEFSLL